MRVSFVSSEGDEGEAGVLLCGCEQCSNLLSGVGTSRCHMHPGLPGCPRTAMRFRCHSGAFPELTQRCLGIVTPVMNVPPVTFSKKH